MALVNGHPALENGLMNMSRATMTGRERLIVVLEIALAVGAYFGAAALATNALDFGDLAEHLPWGSMLLAGLALGLINGVFPTVVAVLAIRRPGTMRTGHLLVGLALCGWIIVQVAIIGLGHWLQPLYFFWGVAIVILAWTLPPASGQHPLRVRAADITGITRTLTCSAVA